MEKNTVKLSYLVMGLIIVFLGLSLTTNSNSALEDKSKTEREEFASGEFIIKLKEGASLKDIEKLNAKYKVIKTKGLLKETPKPQEILTQLKEKLASLNKEHQARYRQLNKNSQEYNAYLSELEKEKATVEKQIKTQEALITRLEQRQKRAPKGATTPNLENIYLLTVSSKANILDIVADYQANPAVEFAQPNYIYTAMDFPQDLPNDTYADPEQKGTWSTGAWGKEYEDLWGLKKIHAPEAWPISQGEGVIVAVIDSGVDYNHEDIKENMWQDALGNYGYDFVNSDNDPMDDNGHGTHVAGTIAAVGNNHKGIIGVAPQAKIMAVKGLDSNGNSDTNSLANCIRYAADNGADVLSNSWAPGKPIGSDPLNGIAVDYAYSKGCVVVFAAGNNDNAVRNYSPQNRPNVITVAATDHNDKKTDLSNWGYGISVAAPGGDSKTEDGPDGHKLSRNILSLRAQDTDFFYDEGISLVPIFDQTAKYYRARGTSFACPHVSGLAALLLSKYPNESNESIRSRIEQSTDPIMGIPPEGNIVEQQYIGTGRINAYRALTISPKPYFTIEELKLEEAQGNGNQIPESNESIKLIIKLKNHWKGASSVQATLSGGNEYISRIINLASDFKSIAQSETKDNQDNPFIFKVGNLKYYDHLVNFTLNTNSDGVLQELKLTVRLGSRCIANDTLSLSHAPTISGNKIVWTVNRNYKGDIYLYDLDAQQETHITTDPYDQSEPAISGNKIVWTDFRNGPGSDIYLYDSDTNKEMRITTKSANYDGPSISGNKIVWNNDSNDKGNIYLYDLDTQNETPIPNSGSQYRSDISDNKIVWTNAFLGGNIYLYDLDNLKETRITTTFFGTAPVISGNKIVWTKFSNDPGSDIYLYDLDTNKEMRITTKPTAKSPTAISGNKIVWSDFRNNNGDIYLYDLEAGQEIPITTNPAPQFHPAISGNKIVWIEKESTDYGIYVADLSSQNKVFLRGDANDDGQIDLADAISILNVLFMQKEKPSCLDALDVDGNGLLTIGDAIYLLNYLFADGPAPVK